MKSRFRRRKLVVFASVSSSSSFLWLSSSCLQSRLEFVLFSSSLLHCAAQQGWGLHVSDSLHLSLHQPGALWVSWPASTHLLRSAALVSAPQLLHFLLQLLSLHISIPPAVSTMSTIDTVIINKNFFFSSLRRKITVFHFDEWSYTDIFPVSNILPCSFPSFLLSFCFFNIFFWYYFLFWTMQHTIWVSKHADSQYDFKNSAQEIIKKKPQLRPTRWINLSSGVVEISSDPHVWMPFCTGESGMNAVWCVSTTTWVNVLGEPEVSGCWAVVSGSH